MNSEVTQQYLSQILETTKYVNFRGIPMPRDERGLPMVLEMPLERIYIQLLAKEIRSKPSTTPDYDMDIYGAVEEFSNKQLEIYSTPYPLEPSNPLLLLDRHQKVLILGGPGSGKTTILRYFARIKAKHTNNLIPIIVKLGEYASALSQNQTLSLMDFALAMASQSNPEFYEILRACINERVVVWLLDGLDEGQNWESIISPQIRQLPGKVILTSRPIGYSIDELVDFPKFEINPLTKLDVSKFVRDWFAFLAEKRGRDSRWTTERIEWLKQRLDSQPRIAELTSNPLLLTFLTILAGEEPKKELPSHRTALYRKYIDELLESWEIHRRSIGGTKLRIGTLETGIAHEELLNGIYLIGWKLHLIYYGGKLNQAPTRARLCKFLENYYIKDWGQNANVNSRAILEFWIDAGLLETWFYRDREFIAFRHYTFQEFTAGWGLAKILEHNPKRAMKFMMLRLHHPAWREPILMMSTMLSKSTFDYFARTLFKGKSRLENHLHRDLRLLGISFIERKTANRPVSEWAKDNILARLKKLLLQPFALPGEIVDIFEKLAPIANNVLLDSLKTNYIEVFEAVICTLARILKDDAIPLIVQYHDKEQAKDEALINDGLIAVTIRAIGETRSPKAVPYLTTWHFYDSGMGADASAALAKIGDPSALPFLLHRLMFGWRSAVPAMFALADFDHNIVVPFLESASQDDFGDRPRSVLELIRFREDCELLKNMILSWKGSPEFSLSLDEILSRLLEEFGQLDVEALNEYHQEMVTLLSQIDISSSAPYLKTYLTSHQAFESLILDILLEIHSDKSIDLLEILSTSTNSYISKRATDLLGELKTSSLANFSNELDDLLKAPITGLAIERIIELDPDNDSRVTDYMIATLMMKNLSYERDLAYRYLWMKGSTEAIPIIIEMIRNDELSWGEYYFPAGLSSFKKSKDRKVVEGILKLLVKKFSIDSVLVSFSNPNYKVNHFFKDILILFMSLSSYKEVRRIWDSYHHRNSGSISYYYANEFEALEKITQMIDVLTVKIKTINEHLLLIVPGKFPIKDNRILVALILTIATIAGAYLPNFLSLPVIPRIVLSLVVGGIIYIATYYSLKSGEKVD